MPDGDLKDALDIGPDTMGRTQIRRPITREEAVRIAQDARKRAERTRTEFAEKEAGMSEQEKCPKCGSERDLSSRYAFTCGSDWIGVLLPRGMWSLVESADCLCRQLAAMTQRAEGSEQAARDWKKVADEATGERDNLIRAIEGPADELISVADALEQAKEQRFAFEKLCEVEAIEADRDQWKERAEKAEVDRDKYLHQSRTLDGKLFSELASEHVTEWMKVVQDRDRLQVIVGGFAELVEDAFRQGARLIPPGEFWAGWWDTNSISTWAELGDWLTARGTWERHPDGYGRRQFYRPRAAEKAKGTQC